MNELKSIDAINVQKFIQNSYKNVWEKLKQNVGMKEYFILS